MLLNTLIVVNDAIEINNIIESQDLNSVDRKMYIRLKLNISLINNFNNFLKCYEIYLNPTSRIENLYDMKLSIHDDIVYIIVLYKKFIAEKLSEIFLPGLDNERNKNVYFFIFWRQ